ncbi:type II secretion system protein J [Planctomycetota bacterium]
MSFIVNKHNKSIQHANRDNVSSAGGIFLKFAFKREKTCYNKGFTLIELLISITIFLFLGILLVSLFQSGMDLWHSGEAGKTLYSRARNVLSVFRDDFIAMYRHPCPRDNGEEVDVRLVSDLVEDSSLEYFSQRIRFVRTVPDEMNDYPLNSAGTYTIADPSDNMKLFDQFNDHTELGAHTLAAAGGLMEVGYLLKSNKLYRAVKGPIGYKTQHMGSLEKISLFNGTLFFSMQNSILAANAGDTIIQVDSADAFPAAPDTASWDISDPRQAGEAAYRWDSTCVNTNVPENHPFAFDDSDTVGDPSNDIFPAKAKVLLVADSNRRTKAISRFVKEESGAYERRFIKIGNEWISYSSVDGDSFVVDERGARNTVQTAHSAGEEVLQGRLFTLIIDIPGAENE